MNSIKLDIISIRYCFIFFGEVDNIKESLLAYDDYDYDDYDYDDYITDLLRCYYGGVRSFWYYYFVGDLLLS